ncbi:hypothetical protein C8J55DRAFT_527802 [Lentinula edodes]|uniref:Uncharacterized protein n=1 Tax=Lentinula lateritia TaxID=40482 RepID=A0A9W8ZSW1_9AGAR|nr:hypothetical protein C8J55DRAFT_527802 [Lentinula edodes]
MNDGHKLVQPSATEFVRTRLSSVAGCLYQLLRELQVRGLSSPYFEESQEEFVQIFQEDQIQSLRAEYRNTLRLCQSLSPRIAINSSPPSRERPLRGSSSLCRTCHGVSSFCVEGHSQLLPPKSNSGNLEIFDAQSSGSLIWGDCF